MARSDVELMKLLSPAWPSMFLLYWTRKPVPFKDIETFCGKDAAGYFEFCIVNSGRSSASDLVTTVEPVDFPELREHSFVLTKRGRNFMRALATLMQGVEWWSVHGAAMLSQDP